MEIGPPFSETLCKFLPIIMWVCKFNNFTELPTDQSSNLDWLDNSGFSLNWFLIRDDIDKKLRIRPYGLLQIRPCPND
jgi:hypothetical protein